MAHKIKLLSELYADSGKWLGLVFKIKGMISLIYIFFIPGSVPKKSSISSKYIFILSIIIAFVPLS
jgi:hypothetical protein